MCSISSRAWLELFSIPSLIGSMEQGMKSHSHIHLSFNLGFNKQCTFAFKY